MEGSTVVHVDKSSRFCQVYIGTYTKVTVNF